VFKRVVGALSLKRRAKEKESHSLVIKQSPKNLEGKRGKLKENLFVPKATLDGNCLRKEGHSNSKNEVQNRKLQYLRLEPGETREMEPHFSAHWQKRVHFEGGRKRLESRLVVGV